MHQNQAPQSLILVGPPNSGKTSLFNWLTRSRFRAVNYPGSTVETLRGHTHARYGRRLEVIDSPGIYSLEPHSPDEEITVRLLRGDTTMGRLDVAVVCVDANQLERHLPLVLKIQRLGWPLVIALTMNDLAEQGGRRTHVDELSRQLAVPVIPVNGINGNGVAELVQAVTSLPAGGRERVNEMTEFDALAAARAVQGWVSQVQERPAQVAGPVATTARLDGWLLHPVFGGVAFLAAMVGLFTAVFWVADPMMGAVDEAFSALGGAIHHVWGDGLWVDFVADGLVASVAAVAVFVPQILILFFLLGLLEDSGYLARAATLVDRPLALMGLSGRSFVPLLSGYACAVPAIMAARAIRSSRERWLAIFIIPLLSCSARLPVYALLLGYIFRDRPAWQPGLAMAAIYLGSFFVGATAAVALNRLLPGDRRSSFMLELPLYRRPQLRAVIRHAITRTRIYAVRAGPIIFALALILWTATTFPRAPEATTSSAQVEGSYAGQIGKWIEPAFAPMGLDWRVGVSLISAFAAREVFVSALALVYDVTTEGDDDTIRSGLLAAMDRATLSSGAKVFTPSSLIGLILFFMIALQCSSTTAIAAREMGSWRFAVGQLVGLNLAAYLVAVVVVQGARYFGFN